MFAEQLRETLLKKGFPQLIHLRTLKKRDIRDIIEEWTKIWIKSLK